MDLNVEIKGSKIFVSWQEVDADFIANVALRKAIDFTKTNRKSVLTEPKILMQIL